MTAIEEPLDKRIVKSIKQPVFPLNSSAGVPQQRSTPSGEGGRGRCLLRICSKSSNEAEQ